MSQQRLVLIFTFPNKYHNMHMNWLPDNTTVIYGASVQIPNNAGKMPEKLA